VTPLIPVGATSSAGPPSASSGSLAKPLIFGTLGLSLVLFALAALPRWAMPRRPVAYFIQQRQLDLTLIGVVVFVITIIEILVTKG
jgi:hypothetical protein